MVGSSPASCAVVLVLLMALPSFTSSRRVMTPSDPTQSEPSIEPSDDTKRSDAGNVGSVTTPNELKLGPAGGPLVPALVNKEFAVYKLREKFKFGNNYKAKRVTREGSVDALELDGKWRSKYFGHGSMHVKNPATGEEIFKVRRSRHAWNPVEWIGRFSFRVLPPGSKDDADAIYTINKDYIGRGLLLNKEEWRIYRGRQSDGQLAYYCVGSWMGWSMKCYNSVRDYNTGRNGLTVWGPPDVRHLPQLEPVLAMSKKFGLATFVGGLGDLLLTDGLYLKMAPEADAALFLAFAAILDTAHDVSGKGTLIAA